MRGSSLGEYHTSYPDTHVLLIGLPLLSNVASFVIFAPLFVPGRAPTNVDFRSTSAGVGGAILVIELIALLLIVRALRREEMSLKSIVNFHRDRVQTYLCAGTIALLPTLAAGWLYSQAQAQAGVESKLSQMSWGEIGLWYFLTPISSAFLEETIWRGYIIPRLQGLWRSLLFTSLSFALFHGFFNPLAVVGTLIHGLVWGWAYRRTRSTVPGMALHFFSRYLALFPGFG
jgi:membrane protease YdiL (CAAX protease family)